MKVIITMWLILISTGLMAYEVAQYSKVFVDPLRNNRQINTVIYYPVAEDAMEEAFPYIIFGHGWIMNHSLYGTLTNNLVSMGMIMAYPRTEEGLFPDHYEFALDISFLEGALFTENLNPDSPLFGIMEPLSIAMGHSMGGGAAVLAAAMDNGFDSLVTFAAAETSVSAISAAQNIFIPSITFSGSSDTITPPAQHQLPIYNNLASDYKCYISILGAGHLNLYNNSLIPQFLEPWLAYLRTGQISYIYAFEHVLDKNLAEINYQVENNLVVSVDEQLVPAIQNRIFSFPNPFQTVTTFRINPPAKSRSAITIYNLKGQQVRTLPLADFSESGSNVKWDGTNDAGKKLPPGVYLYRWQEGGIAITGKVLMRSSR
ncbi:MAG: FlgD immunoglobulin-like domain containing protein [Candidatus Cloacimonadaceae bacterium]|nr:FlgD immunoglobulin-like domain containing protein [Candidatus Cloacimonadaceae bacterium]